MTKTQAIAKAGSAARLARLLGISKSAVSQWPETIPELQRYRLKEMRPKWFAQVRREQAEKLAA
jgi:predicted transcriptional regulator